MLQGGMLSQQTVSFVHPLRLTYGERWCEFVEFNARWATDILRIVRWQSVFLQGHDSVRL